MMVFGLFEPHVLLTFLGAGIVLNLTPGADVAFTMASGLKGGKRGAVAALKPRGHGKGNICTGCQVKHDARAQKGEKYMRFKKTEHHHEPA